MLKENPVHIYIYCNPINSFHYMKISQLDLDFVILFCVQNLEEFFSNYSIPEITFTHNQVKDEIQKLNYKLKKA